MADLKPCPFCRNIPGPVLFARNNASESVVCNKCGAGGPMGNTEEEAATLWNQQAPAGVPGTYKDVTGESNG